jgi:hypothetical protein
MGLLEPPKSKFCIPNSNGIMSINSGKGISEIESEEAKIPILFNNYEGFKELDDREKDESNMF